MRCNSRRPAYRYFICATLCYALIMLLCVPLTQRSVSAGKDSLKPKVSAPRSEQLGRGQAQRVPPPASNSSTRPAQGNFVQAPNAPIQGNERSGELLIRFRSGVSEQEKATTIAGQGARSRRPLRGESGIEKIELGEGQEPEAAAQQWRLNPGIELAEPNFLIRHDQFSPRLSTAADALGSSRQSQLGPNANNFRSIPGDLKDSLNLNPAKNRLNTTALAVTPQSSGVDPSDPRFGEQWALRNIGQNGGQFGSDIEVTGAWQTITGSPSIVISVIDSGIDFTHPDLINNEWQNPAPSANGDLNGWDYVTDSGIIRDEQGHGTAIAGIIAAQGNNGVGISGVLWRASLMSLRVLDNTGTGDVGNAVEAIDYAVAHNAQVLNLSWGTAGESLALKDAIQRAIQHGVVVVCSAGNSGQDLDTAAYYPASFGIRDLIAVAATDNNDQLPSWSNWGIRNVTVAAPGTNILTTRMGGDYWTVTGTSAAAPIVSGVAGLMRSGRPWVNAHLITKAITDGVRQVATLSTKVSTGGVVSATGAFDNLHGAPNPVPIPTPGYGSGGRGPGGSFSTTPPPTTSGAPGGLANLDQLRNAQPTQPRAKAPIQSNLPCADCDPYGGGGGSSNYPSGDPNFSKQRMQPPNETGQPSVDLGSGNFNWSLPILSLPGRAGLDLNLTLSYNSLVWTRDGAYIKYNADLGSPAPGFRLDLPNLQQRFYNSQTGIYAYMMVTSSGGRIELRQVTTNSYEAADGSNTQLTATQTRCWCAPQRAHNSPSFQ